ncbi:hypothetical protein SDC9_60100 [bioreactor metagenome]|uniref:Uncharacterized protein n=1 Tax=bioreactor metagenome TaxID=1076179 RepID=A0A644XDC3_9ZZZZ
MKMRGVKQPSSKFRAMLTYIKPGCYIEAENPQQNGTVAQVITNKYGIPVCAKVESGDGGWDYISMDSVSFFEPYDEYAITLSEFEGDEAGGGFLL